MIRSALVTLVLVIASPASAQIFQPGTQPVGATTGAIMTPIQSSQPCRTCHSGLDDSDDYEPWESWRGSLMANAARDPVFRAALSIAEVDNPNAPDFCVRCHSPEAWFRGRSEVPEYNAAAPMIEDAPRFHPDDPAHAPVDDLDGVACMVCHRSEDPTDAQLFNTRLVLHDTPGNGDQRYGPYSYVGAAESPPHPTDVSTFLPTSRLCGQCHDITSPVLMGHRVEASGVVDTTRPFAVERTFSEWRSSAFPGRSQTCQSCHMPVVDHAVPVANFGSFADAMHTGVSRHYLLGAAQWQLRAIADVIPNIPAGLSSHLTDNADRIGAFIQTAASVEIRAHTLDGTTATASVRVTNHTGHKLPTGYPEGRQMWLEIDVLDGSGRSVAGSARFNPTTGAIENDAQARTYDSELGVRAADGTVTPGFHFILSDTLIRDTRIPPEGFAPSATDDDAPLGRDYSDGAGGYHNYDEVAYTLPALCGTGTLQLRARLRYQATTQEYIEYLRDHSPASADPALAGGNWGMRAYSAWMTHGGATPIEMASATVDLGPAPMPCAAPDAGHDGGPALPDASVDASMTADAATPPAPASNCGCATTGRGPTGIAAWIALAIVVTLRRRRR